MIKYWKFEHEFPDDTEWLVSERASVILKSLITVFFKEGTRKESLKKTEMHKMSDPFKRGTENLNYF